jgi:hypothetical protein
LPVPAQFANESQNQGTSRGVRSFPRERVDR